MGNCPGEQQNRSDSRGCDPPRNKVSIIVNNLLNVMRSFNICIVFIQLNVTRLSYCEHVCMSISVIFRLVY